MSEQASEKESERGRKRGSTEAQWACSTFRIQMWSCLYSRGLYLKHNETQRGRSSNRLLHTQCSSNYLLAFSFHLIRGDQSISMKSKMSEGYVVYFFVVVIIINMQ